MKESKAALEAKGTQMIAEGLMLLEKAKEMKYEPDPVAKITGWEDAFRKLKPKYYIDAFSATEKDTLGVPDHPVGECKNLLPTEKDCQDVLKHIQRKLIAIACGGREFQLGEYNWHCFYDYAKKEWEANPILDIKEEASNYFPTKEQAQEYLDACLNDGLL
jgi:hypothetical protein